MKQYDESNGLLAVNHGDRADVHVPGSDDGDRAPERPARRWRVRAWPKVRAQASAMDMTLPFIVNRDI
jgi:hypothetical protein